MGPGERPRLRRVQDRRVLAVRPRGRRAVREPAEDPRPPVHDRAVRAAPGVEGRRPMTATLSLAVFFQQSRDWHPSPALVASHALIREGLTLAAETLTDDPLRGDPLSPEVQRVASVVCLLRATAAEPDTDTPETVPVLAPGELTVAATVSSPGARTGTVSGVSVSGSAAVARSRHT